jgi:hypothetical protein
MSGAYREMSEDCLAFADRSTRTSSGSAAGPPHGRKLCGRDYASRLFKQEL